MNATKIARRALSLLLTLCLLGALSGASAQDDALRVLDGWRAMEAYQAQYPDRPIEAIEHFDDQGRSVVERVLLSGEWDAACVDTDQVSLRELDRLGLLYDLGQVEAAAAQAENLYPSIRAGCSVEGKLAALPAGFLNMRAYQFRLLGTDFRGEADAEGAALRDRLGFTEADQPATFAEVCALGLRYMALDRETRKGTLFLFSDTAPQGFALLNYMILAYETEMTDENGHIDFDTPAFRAALEAAEPLLQAFAADPKRTYASDGSLNVVLCDDLLQGYGAYPRVTEGDSIPVFMTVVVVNPNSKRLSQAIDYALTASGCGDSALPLYLYQNADYDALLRQSYDRDIAAQIEQGEAPSVIEELEARKAAGDDRYFTPRRSIERYAADIAPRLTFSRWQSIATDSPIFDYLKGKTDAEGFIKTLNEVAAAER